MNYSLPTLSKHKLKRLYSFARFAKQTRNTIASDVIQVAALQISALLGKKAESFIDSEDNGNVLLQSVHHTENRKALCLHRILEGFVHLVYGDTQQAFECARNAP